MSTLLEKLNYKGQKRIVVMNSGRDFILGSDDEIRDVQIDSEIDQRFPYEFMLIFVRKITEVKAFAPLVLHNLVDNGVLWFCYQKSSGKCSSELNRENGWQSLNDMDFYGTRVISVSIRRRNKSLKGLHYDQDHHHRDAPWRYGSCCH
ncbi:MAG: hypothetical protein IPI69_13130 [Bacteroidales bacterium]|nr:hypothetical protein [Bacteroidales bacterium]